MIDNDVFVFDGVCHVYDFSADNARSERPDTATMHQAWRYIIGALQWPSPEVGKFTPEFDWSRRFSIEDMYELEFVLSPVDMAMAHAVPVWDWFHNSFAPVEMQHAFTSAHPERVVLCGAVDPLHHGVEGAKQEMERQVKELGARSFKFYNGHVDQSWRCDDRELAYPLYEQAQDLGVNLLQFHKGLPFGMWDVDVLRPVDLQRPARDFPDMIFVIHHLAYPYFDEVVNIASRFPNIYLALSGVMSFLHIAPKKIQIWMGELLQNVGAYKLIWGSEAAMTGPPGPFLKAFMELEIPEELQADYGYPQITRDDKKMILGLNMAGLLGIDVEAKVKELQGLAR